jgi:hypothetical protein
MRSRLRITLVTVGLLAFLVMPGAARDAHAIPIDNSVDIEWQNVKYLVEPALVTGGNFTASLDDLDQILFTVLITIPNDIQGFELVLSVGSSLSEIESNATPFQLKYAAGENKVGGDFPYPADPYEGSASIFLSQFQNYATLVGQMQDGLPLAFSLDGRFFGDINAGGNLTPCNQLPVGQCPTWPGQISVAVSGAPTSVPEPSSLALLSIGSAIALSARRRRR